MKRSVAGLVLAIVCGLNFLVFQNCGKFEAASPLSAAEISGSLATKACAESPVLGKWGQNPLDFEDPSSDLFDFKEDCTIKTRRCDATASITPVAAAEGELALRIQTSAVSSDCLPVGEYTCRYKVTKGGAAPDRLDVECGGVLPLVLFSRELSEPQPSPSPTATPAVSPTATPTASPSPTPTPEPTSTPEATPTATPEATPTPEPTPEPTATPLPMPTPAIEGQRAIYFTTTTYNANFQSVAVADAACMTDANKPFHVGSAKALVAAANRVPGGSDWVLAAETNYKGTDSLISFTTDENAAFRMGTTLPNGQKFTDFWLGFKTSTWVTDAANSCSNWTSRLSSSSGTTGKGGLTFVYYSRSLCDQKLKFLCVQQ